MKVTFDSNLWERIVHPHVFPLPEERNAQLTAVHDALKSKKIEGFICQSVATLEAIKRKDRTEFMTTQTMRPKIIEKFGPDFRPVVLAPDQSKRPRMMPVLEDRLRDAVELGIKIIEIPVYVEMELPEEYMAAMTDEYIEKFGLVEFAIRTRGVGRALLRQVGRDLAIREGGRYLHSVDALPNVKNITEEENRLIIKAVAEAADGDAVAAHIAFGCDLLVSLDYGKSAGAQSILDMENRDWLRETYNVRFCSLAELVEYLSK